MKAKIALFGATGMIGQRVLNEALRRGHPVTAIVRDPASMDLSNPNLMVVAGDVMDVESIAQKVVGHDVVVSTLGPGLDADPEKLVTITRSLLEGVRHSGIKRVIAVGGAGSLEVAPGVQLADTPQFPPAWKGIASAHRDALDVYKQEQKLDWVNVSPAALIEPGTRTGQYRTGTDQLLTNAHGESKISAEDFAVAIIDEVEQPHFSRQRFCVAY
ncbi:hypothetical protein KDW_60940 [Dictyobacter vulcani]|uniref:NAD(P)-binding domain-containing protein n=1 Tax=Dictyobacter vulcani TaxID=2607529 RepID=A0A5J4KXY5_9CHLR|nr:NAD(P)-dependent oxidoreductase [Dictyobacter vulcani]GER91932.1 hypothetical protein KDW_60940 [Dictyobacter vulcani]